MVAFLFTTVLLWNIYIKMLSFIKHLKIIAFCSWEKCDFSNGKRDSERNRDIWEAFADHYYSVSFWRKQPWGIIGIRTSCRVNIFLESLTLVFLKKNFKIIFCWIYYFWMHNDEMGILLDVRWAELQCNEFFLRNSY